MEKSKILTFIGFSIRARKIKCGVNAVKTLKKAYVLIICSTASKNTFDESVSLAKKLSAKLIVCNGYVLADVICKENCKLIALTDEGLSKAVLEHLDGHFTEYSGGNDR